MFANDCKIYKIEIKYEIMTQVRRSFSKSPNILSIKILIRHFLMNSCQICKQKWISDPGGTMFIVKKFKINFFHPDVVRLQKKKVNVENC